MAKRFTDSDKFRDVWYRQLKPKHKCLWEYMLSECSIAGILDIDFDSMSFHIGDKITEKDLEIFSDRIIFLSLNKIFIPRFIKFQQNNISETNPAHKNIIKILENYNIDLSLSFQSLKSTFEGASKELQSSISNGNGNSIGNGISKSKNENLKNKFGEFGKVLLTTEEELKLKSSYGSNFDLAIDTLDRYIASNNKKYASHYAVMKANGWVWNEVMKNNTVTIDKNKSIENKIAKMLEESKNEQ